jgi:hypothetical protein
MAGSLQFDEEHRGVIRNVRHGVRDGRHVQQQVGGTAERGVHQQCVVDRLAGEDLRQRRAGFRQRHQRERGPPCHVGPHRFAGRRQRTVRQRDAQRFGNHLRGRRGAEELAAATR